MTTALDVQAPEDSTGAPEQMSSTRGMFPLGPVPEQPFNYILMVLVNVFHFNCYFQIIAKIYNDSSMKTV